MSLGEWRPIPDGLLRMRMTPRAFGRLKYDVQVLISQIAEEQKYKCAFCGANKSLEIEHEHYPEYDPEPSNDKYTIYNVRGLVCHWHNIQLMIHECDERGLSRGLSEATSWLSDHQYESYIYRYHLRAENLYEDYLEKIVSNYPSRRLLLNKFDEWRYHGGREYPWYWGFDEIKDQKYGKIRNRKQFFKVLAACLQFIKGELEKNPDFDIPEQFLRFMARVKPFVDQAPPIVETPRQELGKGVISGSI
jgi:hypothetical protein